jgi:hypothetical protein
MILITWNSGGISSDMSYLGFNYFLVVFRFPLGFLALYVPIIALIASSHRSIQTRAQIQLNIEQNLFANKYKHIEEFEKYYKNNIVIKGHGNLTINNIRNCYNRLFKNSSIGKYNIDASIYNVIQTNYIKIYDSIEKFNQQGNTPLQIMNDMYFYADNIGRTCFLDFNLPKPNLTLSIELLSFLNALTSRSKQLIQLLEFGDDSQYIDALNNVAHMNLAVVPKACDIENGGLVYPLFDPLN